MFGKNPNSNILNFTIDQIPNEALRRMAYTVGFSQGRINHAVKTESLALITAHAERLGIKIADVLCEVCAWPIIDDGVDVATATIIVQRIEPFGFLRNTQDVHCERRESMP